VQGRRGWVRLHEKRGKEHTMPTHHNLDDYLEEYVAVAGIAQDRKGPLFRNTKGRTGELTGNPMLQSYAGRMIRDARPRQESRPRSAAIPSVQPASLPISRTAEARGRQADSRARIGADESAEMKAF
jgi:hypothetical protein